MRRQTLTGKFPTERPPDPENGSPGAVGTATGADRKKDVPGRTSKTYLSFSQLVQSQSTVVVYDGRELVGVIIKSDGHYDAFDTDGRCVGSFQTRTDAMRAVPQSANAAKSNKENIARQHAR
jgi:hypothetical protein